MYLTRQAKLQQTERSQALWCRAKRDRSVQKESLAVDEEAGKGELA